MDNPEQVISHTKKWITDVVIGCNFCPFAAREVKRNSIRYHVETSSNLNTVLSSLMEECQRLDEDPGIATTLIIYPENFTDFEDYLELLGIAEALLAKEGYEGIYQLASFHPEYQFGGTDKEDASNYTNRSPYPMLHLLREEDVEKAIAGFPDPDSIPEKNIAFTKKMGREYMQQLWRSCFMGT